MNKLYNKEVDIVKGLNNFFIKFFFKNLQTTNEDYSSYYYFNYKN